MKKLIFGVIFLGLSAVYLIYIYNKPVGLTVDLLDVGQGDAILIRTPSGQTVLIDGGPDNKVLRRLGERLPYYQRRIDFVLISHFHDDHTIGLVELAKRFSIGQIVYASDLHPSPVIEELSKNISRRSPRTNSTSTFPVTGMAEILLGKNCVINLLNPAFLGVKADDNNSLAARLDCLGQNFLFSGDNSAAVEKALLKSGWPLKSLVFKASHHGSNSANSQDFLQAVDPDLLMISVGADNKFGHPNPKVLDRAESLNISVRRTDQEGNLSIFSPKNREN